MKMIEFVKGGYRFMMALTDDDKIAASVSDPNKRGITIVMEDHEALKLMNFLSGFLYEIRMSKEKKDEVRGN